MRKIIGIGETIFDIVFVEGEIRSGKPGGSTYNAMISLGRRGFAPFFISEVGNDEIGRMIRSFMLDNGVHDQYLCTFPEGKSPLALAFLDSNRNAQYSFYKDYPAQRLQFEMPDVQKDDVVMFGSYFALNPVLRAQVVRFLDYARSRGAIIYYDINFRATHKNEIEQLMPTIIENYHYADVVKGSIEDFEILYGLTNPSSVYEEKIKEHCQLFVCTLGRDGAYVRCANQSASVKSEKDINVVSTIGAGDSFNAGFVAGLVENNYMRDDLKNVDIDRFVKCPIESAMSYAIEVCQSYENYVAQK